MKAAFLSDRGVVRISGDDARVFLNGLVTTEVAMLPPGQARFGALLTPQGKIIADFLIAAEHDGGGLLLDIPSDLAQSLATKLGFYKLRAKVVVENLSDSHGVLALWGGEADSAPSGAFADPRQPELGYRLVVARDQAAASAAALGAEVVDVAVYDAQRILCGVPRGGVDYAYGDAYPHETNMDRLNGVDFDKGCYVGQEVVSRMQHRGTARTRTVRLLIDGPMPEAGAPVTAGGKPLGTLGSSADGRALALLRIDRVHDALDAGLSIAAGEAQATIAAPEDIRLAAKALRI